MSSYHRTNATQQGNQTTLYNRNARARQQQQNNVNQTPKRVINVQGTGYQTWYGISTGKQNGLMPENTRKISTSNVKHNGNTPQLIKSSHKMNRMAAMMNDNQFEKMRQRLPNLQQHTTVKGRMQPNTRNNQVVQHNEKALSQTNNISSSISQKNTSKQLNTKYKSIPAVPSSSSNRSPGEQCMHAFTTVMQSSQGQLMNTAKQFPMEQSNPRGSFQRNTSQPITEGNDQLNTVKQFPVEQSNPCSSFQRNAFQPNTKGNDNNLNLTLQRQANSQQLKNQSPNSLTVHPAHKQEQSIQLSSSGLTKSNLNPMQQRVVKLAAELAKAKRTISELKKHQEAKDGTIKILRSSLEAKKDEVFNLQKNSLGNATDELIRLNPMKLKMEIEKLKSSLTFKEKDLEDMRRESKRLRVKLNQVEQNSSAVGRYHENVQPITQGVVKSTPTGSIHRSISTNSTTNTTVSPLTKRKRKHESTGAIHLDYQVKIISLTEESMYDILMLLRYSATQIDRTKKSSLISRPISPRSPPSPMFAGKTNRIPSTPPVLPPTNSELLISNSASPKRTGAKHFPQTPDISEHVNHNSKNTLGNFKSIIHKKLHLAETTASHAVISPNATQDRFCRAVPSPLSFLPISQTSKSLSSDGKHSNHLDPGLWHAVKLYRCLFRNMAGVSDLVSLLYAVGEYLDPNLSIPQKVRVSAIRIAEAVVKLCQKCQVLIKQVDSKKSPKANSTQLSGAKRAFEELQSSGRLSLRRKIAKQSTAPSQSTAMAEGVSDAERTNLVIIPHCFTFLKQSLAKNTIKLEHLPLVNTILKFFCSISLFTSSASKKLSVLNPMIEGWLFGMLLTGLHGTEQIRIDSLLSCVELVGFMVQQGSNTLLSKYIPDKDKWDDIQIPSMLFNELVVDPFETSKDVAIVSRRFELQFSIIRVLSSVVSQYGQLGVCWLLHVPHKLHYSLEGKAQCKGLVSCLVTSLYNKLDKLDSAAQISSVVTDNLATTRFEIFCESFSLLCTIWPTYEDQYKPNDGRTDKQKFTSILTKIRQRESDARLKNAARHAEELLQTMI